MSFRVPECLKPLVTELTSARLASVRIASARAVLPVTSGTNDGTLSAAILLPTHQKLQARRRPGRRVSLDPDNGNRILASTGEARVTAVEDPFLLSLWLRRQD